MAKKPEQNEAQQRASARGIADAIRDRHGNNVFRGTPAEQAAAAADLIGISGDAFSKATPPDALSAARALGSNASMWVLYLIGRLSAEDHQEAESIARAIAKGETPFTYATSRDKRG